MTINTTLNSKCFNTYLYERCLAVKPYLPTCHSSCVIRERCGGEYILWIVRLDAFVRQYATVSLIHLLPLFHDMFRPHASIFRCYISCTEAAALLCHVSIQVWFSSHVALSHVRYSHQLLCVCLCPVAPATVTYWRTKAAKQTIKGMQQDAEIQYIVDILKSIYTKNLHKFRAPKSDTGDVLMRVLLFGRSRARSVPSSPILKYKI
jgi:hypothetical protein